MQKLSRTRRGEIAYLNLLRSMAIYMVIALHCVRARLTDVSVFASRTWWLAAAVNGISRMGVPLFFMISGFLSLSGEGALDIKTFYKKRFLRLAVPFIFWDILYFIISSLVSGNGISLPLFFTELFHQGSKYHLWFVYQIAGLYLLAPFLKMIVDRCSKRGLLLFLGIVLLQPTFFGFINSMQSHIKITPFLALIEGYVGFFVYGYILATFKFSRRARILIYTAGLIGLFLNICGNYFLSSGEKISVIFNYGYSVTHYLAAGALFLAARSVFERRPALSSGHFASVISLVSKLSFGIYMSHALMIDLWRRLSAMPWLPSITPAANMVLAFLFASAAATVFAWIFSKLPFLRRIVM